MPDRAGIHHPDVAGNVAFLADMALYESTMKCSWSWNWLTGLADLITANRLFLNKKRHKDTIKHFEKIQSPPNIGDGVNK